MKIIYAIPVLVVIIVMLINLKTGLVFTISRENAFIPGPHRFALIPTVPIWICLGLTFINALFVDKRMAVLCVMLVAVRLLWDLWYPDISSTSFVFTLFLMCIHLFFMNRPYDEEVTEA
jgi:hypothetical protein